MASSTPPPTVIIPMSDYGHDPTETAVPYETFINAGFTVHFATETGNLPRCDSKMIEGTTGKLLGASAAAVASYKGMIGCTDSHPGSINKPLVWTDPGFSFQNYDLVFLPGGHDKGVRQLIDSETIHSLLVEYFPLTKRETEGSKVIAAVCHGVQVLAFTPDPSSPTKDNSAAGYKSIIHACSTTSLTSFMETSITIMTKPFLGDYYKTYGSCTPNVEEYVSRGLDNPKTQFKTGPKLIGMNDPFIVEDKGYRYVSGRFPPDSEMLAKRAIELVKAEKAGSLN